MRRFLAALLIALGLTGPAAATQIPYYASGTDTSQLIALFNNLIQQLNPILNPLANQPGNLYLTPQTIYNALGYVPGSNTVCAGAVGGLVPTPPNSASQVLLGNCTWGAAPAAAIVVGTTGITSGTSFGLVYNNSSVVGNTAAGTSGQLLVGVTSGAPAWATMGGDATITNAGAVSVTGGSHLTGTLASGLTAPSLTVTTAFTATGLVTNADLANPATTVNGQTCTLGSTCTAAAAAGTLTGGTLASGVTASSLVSVGTLTGGATGSGFTIDLTTSTVSHVLPAANGGAGTITGALKANGSGTVSQAACADLSNAGTGCSAAAVPQGAWTNFTPTATCGAGSITTDTLAGRYQQIAPKTYLIVVSLSIATLGTCTGSVDLTMPNSATQATTIAQYAGSGLDGTTGAATVFFANTSANTLRFFFAAAPTTNLYEGNVVVETQ